MWEEKLNGFVATRTLLAGTAIVIQKEAVANSEHSIVVSFDGGGMHDREGNLVFGAGCVVYLCSQGQATRIMQVPVICGATTAQQTEAVGAIAANNILKQALGIV